MPYMSKRRMCTMILLGSAAMNLLMGGSLSHLLPARTDPRWWAHIHTHAEKIFSQNGEDGVIKYIFENIGTTNKFYVEFGTQADAAETNTRVLRERNGWTGLLMDCCIKKERPEINLRKESIDPLNVASLFDKYKVPTDLDLLSVDVDSYDFFVWRALINKYRARLVIVEKNSGYGCNATATYPPIPVKTFGWTVGQTCNPKGTREYIQYKCGASLQLMRALGNAHGYELVYAGGVNAFFVRKDMLPKDYAWSFDEAIIEGVRENPRVCQVRAESEFPPKKAPYGDPMDCLNSKCWADALIQEQFGGKVQHIQGA